jgi:hydroxyacylglutathione hydrolase
MKGTGDWMRIETIHVGEMGTNCYLAWDEATNRGFLVDPGEQAEKIIRVCSRYQVKPEAVLLTHGHFDHIMAAKKIRQQYEIPVYAGIHEEELLADSQMNLSGMWAVPYTMKADKLVNDNEVLTIAGMEITVLETPGHTSGGVCYYSKKENVLFAGDTLFCESYGRTDFPGGSMFALLRSLRGKLFVLPEETDVYPGHGQATSIGYEKTHNPAAGA